MEREHKRGRMFCQIVACFDAGDGSYFDISQYYQQDNYAHETVQNAVICVPLLTDYKEYAVTPIVRMCIHMEQPRMTTRTIFLSGSICIVHRTMKTRGCRSGLVAIGMVTECY